MYFQTFPDKHTNQTKIVIQNVVVYVSFLQKMQKTNSVLSYELVWERIQLTNNMHMATMHIAHGIHSSYRLVQLLYIQWKNPT
jgi:hypothetical protein